MLGVDCIRQYPIFTGLNEAELAEIAARMVKRTFARGTYLFYPGNPDSNIYLIEAGLVRLFFYDSKGDEYLLNLLGPRSILGQPMMTEKPVRLLGASVQSSAVLLALAREDLICMMKSSNQLALNMYTEMMSAVRKLLLHYQSIITTGLEGRIAALLLHLGENNMDEIDLPISQADLASWLGVSRPRLNRAMIKFQKMGLTRLAGSTFFLLDRPGLARIAEGLDIADL